MTCGAGNLTRKLILGIIADLGAEGMAQTVSAGYLRALLDYAASRDVAAATLLRGADIDGARLEDPDARLPFDAYKRLMRAAKDLTGDPAFALRFGAAKDINRFSVVGLICYSAPTMGEAFAQLARYSRLVAEVDLVEGAARFRLDADAAGLWLVDARRDPEDFPEFTEATWARFIAETRRHFPGAAFAQEVLVPHPAPPHAAAYDEVLQTPVRFASDRNAMRIDPSWLDIELHDPNVYAFGVLTKHADRLVAALADDDRLPARVERAVLPALHRGEVRMAAVAETLGMSRQTLYRRLAADGARFDQVVDDLRRRLAVDYLEGGRASVNEVAYLVGFSDPSAFSRAFKRWTGVAPRDFKAGKRGPGA